MRRAARPLLLSLALSVVAVASVASCADQGEGERCDVRNNRSGTDPGNADCEAGLVCLPVSQLRALKGAPEGSGLCCPEDPAAASVDACFRSRPSAPGGGTGGGGAGDAGATGGADGG
ncbi:MAG: hypothetical protein FJ104_15855, partial [Deltaproteobacteria bacterium]|nr:hypothetical protein [Deltaproteobacteria bacterium]